MGFTLVKLTATYRAGGQPCSGQVVVSLTVPMQDGSGLRCGALRFVCPLDSSGRLSFRGSPWVTVEANDDASTQPLGATWTVLEQISGSAGARPAYQVVVPSAAAGGTVDLASLAPSLAQAQFGYVLTTTLGKPGSPPALDANGVLSAARVRSGACRAIGLGASVTLGTGTGDGQPGIRDPMSWAQFYADQAFVELRNAGIGGDTTGPVLPSDPLYSIRVTQGGFLGRVQSDVLSYNPDFMVLGELENDNAFGFTPARSMANIEAIWKACVAANVPIVMTTTPPRGANQGTALDQWTHQINFLLRRFAADRHLPIADYYQALVDPVTAGYQAVFNADNAHPSVQGAAVMGQVLAATLKASGLLPPTGNGGITLAGHGRDANSFNMVGNALNQRSTVSAGVADGWVFGGTGTPSLVADAAIVGQWQRITAAAAQSGNQLLIYTVDPSLWSPGDRLAFSGLLSLSLPPNGQAFSVQPVYNAGAIHLPTPTSELPHPPLWRDPDNLTSVSSGGLVTGTRVMAAEWAVPLAATSMQIWVQVGASPATTSASWLQFAQLSLMNMTRFGIPSRLTQNT